MRENARFIPIVLGLCFIFALSMIQADSVNPKSLDGIKTFEKSATLPTSDWYSVFGSDLDDSLNSAIETLDGNYIAAGWTTTVVGDRNVLVVMTDNAGNEIWQQEYGDAQNDEGWSIIQTRDGNFVISGWSGISTYDLLLMKIDNNGKLLWSFTWGGPNNEGGSEVIETIDGSLLVCGWTWSYTNGQSDFLVVKFDPNGNFMWFRNYGGYNADEAAGIVETYDGNYAIIGYTMTYGMASERDIWLIKINPLGGMYWSRTFGGIGREYGYKIIETSDRGFLLVGITESYGAGLWDAWVIKTDRNGNHQWDQTFGGPESDTGVDVIETDDGGYLITGYTESDGSGGKDNWFVKTRDTGILEWSLTYGGSNDDEAKSIVQTSDNGFIVAGYTSSYGAGGKDGWLVKLPFDPVKVLDTPKGENISLVEEEYGVTATFDTVVTEGKTFLAKKPVGPSLELSEVRVSSYYDIKTTAEFEGKVKISIPYDPSSISDPEGLKIKKFEFSTKQWKDVTLSINKNEISIVAEIDSFSIFAIVQPSDSTPPTTEASLEGVMGNDDWYISDVNVTLTATDDISGVANTYYSFDSMSWFDYESIITVSDEGYKDVYYYSVDAIGNMEDIKSVSMKIDKTPPVSTLTIQNYYEKDNIVYVTQASKFQIAATDAMSGLAHMFYRINNSEWKDIDNANLINFTLNITGSYAIEYYSTDYAGNVEEIHLVDVIMPSLDVNAYISNKPSPPFRSEEISEFNVYFVKWGRCGYKIFVSSTWFWYNIEMTNNWPVGINETTLTPLIPSDFEIHSLIVWIDGRCHEIPIYVFTECWWHKSYEWYRDWNSGIEVSFDGQNVTLMNIKPGDTVFLTFKLEYTPESDFYNSIEDFSTEPYNFVLTIDASTVLSDSQTSSLYGVYSISTTLTPNVVDTGSWRFWCCHWHHYSRHFQMVRGRGHHHR